MKPLLRLKLFAAGLTLLCVLALVAHFTRHFAPGKTSRAFYYWKTSWSTTPASEAALADDHITKLYMRFFDVRWSEEAGEPRPVSPLNFAAPPPPNLEIVPVVYIVNEVFQHTRYDQVEAFADHVVARVSGMASANGITPRELQIDCDWSDTTRRNYFHFAELLRRRLRARGVALSATIRLHQIKWAARTGVPPVDRGMLMFYNFGRIAADRKHSSIFNEEDARLYSSYIAGYRLPLDLSLPLFSWVVHSRDGHVLGLLEKVSGRDLAASSAFTPAGPGHFRAASSGFFRGSYFMKGDLLLLEESSPATTEAAARVALEGAGWSKTYDTVALFDLDERNLDHYENHEIQNILAKF